MNFIIYYFLFFFIYSIIGWLVESLYVSILEKKIVNRGFLIGPYCPIYGLGALLIILYIEQYKDNILTVFILGVVICAFLEYITSYLMEKIFKARWWDYSNRKFNLNGRVCLKNAALFGIGGLFIIYITQPNLEKLIHNTDSKILLTISIISFIIILIDTITSFNIVSKLKKNLTNLEIRKDSTQELKNLVTEVLNHNRNTNKNKLTKLQKRLIDAFPDFDIKKLVKSNEKKIKKIKELFK